MPGLSQRNEQLISGNGFWSKQRDDVTCNQLQKFWSELSLQDRQKLLQIDKQTLFEQARKNMYCSRCNGLLLEGFLQIVMFGKSLQLEEGVRDLPYSKLCQLKYQVDSGQTTTNRCHDEIQDPSVHPWGGLTTTRDGSLTLLSCYLCAKSLEGLQIVFDSARSRERERELLYPDACGGGGRGWISQGIVSYGRGHGTRETCALHTSRLSCDTLVDFWSALGEETRQSLLRMKEEDFVERLMYRFDSKRFCRDCRKNVIREYKELKELKRLRRETRCTSWFCVADTAFQYEVSEDTIQVDWYHSFADMVGTYHHFDWAVGTGEGKSDILEFENVGLTRSVQVNGLDLGDLSACFITLRACKLDGRCTEICVKAHALRGQQCVHCSLIVGDGFVTIGLGESIRKLFEHAEEAEEEEDDDSMDKDGNDLDGECSRPQKHAKSPELAREFLLDAATVIFKEQVEKAFREGTARQNAHSIFVCLALKLLEERVHVACKEIITLEKQMKLLEEEEKEKREEEERKEKRRAKERDKKLRRKERLKGKERDKETRSLELNVIPALPDISETQTSHIVDEEGNDSVGRVLVSEIADIHLSLDGSPDMQDQKFSNGHGFSVSHYDSFENIDGSIMDGNDETNGAMFEQSKFSRRRSKVYKEAQLDTSLKWSGRRVVAVDSQDTSVISRCQSDNFDSTSRYVKELNRQPRTSRSKSNIRNAGLKFNSPNYKINEKHDMHACSCHRNGEHRFKYEQRVNAARIGDERKLVNKVESAQDMSKQWGNRLHQADCSRESYGKSKSKIISGNSSFQDLSSNSGTDVTSRLLSSKVGFQSNGELCKSSGDTTESSGKVHLEENNINDARKPAAERCRDENVESKDLYFSTEGNCEEVNSCHVRSSVSTGTSAPSTASISNSEYSSCLSEGDSNTFSSNHGSVETSSTSDSEDAQKLEGRKTPIFVRDGFVDSCRNGTEKKQSTYGSREAVKDEKASGHPSDVPTSNFMWNLPSTIPQCSKNGIPVGVNLQHQSMFQPVHNQGLQFPMIPAPSTIGYYHQNPASWQAAAANGFLPFPQSNQYFYAGDFCYGLNSSSPVCIHYNPMQHLPNPWYNPSPLPVYEPAVKASAFHSEEHMHINKVWETLSEATTEMTCPAGEAVPRRDAVKIDKSAKQHMGDSGFSLFQFDGPLALSIGCKPVPSRNESVEGFSSGASMDQVDKDPAACNKKEIMEEYNLFATQNGIKFSFF